MTSELTKRTRESINAVAFVFLTSICAQFGSSLHASDFDADRHSRYCGCGTACRREKCCCGPAEEPVVPSDAESKSSDSPRPGLLTFRNFICRIVSPCGADPYAPGSRVFRSFLPVSAVIGRSARDDADSGRYLEEVPSTFRFGVFVSGVDRPPECLRFLTIGF